MKSSQNEWLISQKRYYYQIIIKKSQTVRIQINDERKQS